MQNGMAHDDWCYCIGLDAFMGGSGEGAHVVAYVQLVRDCVEILSYSVLRRCATALHRACICLNRGESSLSVGCRRPGKRERRCAMVSGLVRPRAWSWARRTSGHAHAPRRARLGSQRGRPTAHDRDRRACTKCHYGQRFRGGGDVHPPLQCQSPGRAGGRTRNSVCTHTTYSTCEVQW